MKYSSASLAKTSRPNAHLVGRCAAVAAMAESKASLIWLVAPPGSGKTSLCIEYVQQRKCPAAWLRLDEADNDLASFFHYLEQAIINGNIAKDWRVPQLLPEHLPQPAGFMRLFVRSLAAAIVPEACLVLDDAYKCQEACFFCDFLRILHEELPPEVRVLICSRVAAPAGCAKALAYGCMTEIDSSALSFSLEETERLLTTLGVGNVAEIRDAVFNYSHGWAVGIVLMASWLQRRPEAALHLEENMPLLVMGFLSNEVFAAYSPAEQEMLMSVCWLPYFREEWAVELSGIDKAGEIIARLAAGGLIYEYSGHEYSLHRLFRLFLREWSRDHTDETRRLQCIDRCVLLLLSHDDADAAVELALKHGLVERAAALIENQSAELFSEARHQTLARWIGALPEHLRSPWHYYWLGLSLFVNDSARSQEALLRAYTAFAASGNQQYRFLALSWIITSYSLSSSSDVPLGEFLKRYVDVDKDYALLTDDNLKAHLALAVFSGLSVTEPGHPDFELWQGRVETALSLSLDPTLKVRIIIWLCIHSFMSGRYRRLDALQALLDGQPNLQGLPPYARLLANCLRTTAAAAHADHAALALAVAAGRQCAAETGIGGIAGFNSLFLAVSYLLQGDYDNASAAVSEAMSAARSNYFFLNLQLKLTQSWLAAWKGNSSALHFARMMRQADQHSESVIQEILGRTSECIAASLLELPDVALQVAELRQLAQANRYPFSLIHADFLDAWRFVRLGDQESALPYLQSGLKLLGEVSEGYLTSAVPQILQPLCALALRHNIEPEVARSLIRVFRLPPPADSPDSWPWPVTVRCFGGFELLIDGKPLRSQGKTKHRQLDLVKLIAAHAPAPLAMSLIAETLWPDSDGDTAHHALETTLSRLRTTLGCNIFNVEHAAVGLDRKVCWVDTAAFDDRLEFLEKQLGREGEDVAVTASAVLELCRGEFLFGENQAWIIARRDYWRSRIGRIFSAAAGVLLRAGDALAAARLLEHVLEISPHSELMVHALMQIYLDAGHNAQGLAVYQRFCQYSLPVLGVAVPEKVERLAQCLQTPAA
ncbi:MAG: transcriptional regulator [Proteobacteria bacterium]|nr:transcriptional regulator [Pseudomonadota bacterium]